MSMTPSEVLIAAYETAANNSIEGLLSPLSQDCLQDLQIIVSHAESQKAVLGVTLTSVVYKTLHPSQDIRLHQEGMAGGYSGRTFDTKYITPFLQQKFPHFAMAESAWLTRSLEQPHPFDANFPGKIRNATLKTAFLNTARRIEENSDLALMLLNALMALMLQASATDASLFAQTLVASEVPIIKIIEAVSQHIHFDYGLGAAGTARIPVIAIYAVYQLLMPDVRRYAGKTLAPLQSHTSSDARSKTLGDIDVLNPDGTCFESIEIKHNKPITSGMVGIAYRKIKNTNADRYYILTTSAPNFLNHETIKLEIERCKKLHPCQIIVNGVIPSLKYYMRLLSEPQAFIDEYTRWLEFEYRRASGIKKIHLQTWQTIRNRLLSDE